MWHISIDFNYTPFGNISYDYIKYYVFIDNNQTPQEKRDSAEEGRYFIIRYNLCLPVA